MPASVNVGFLFIVAGLAIALLVWVLLHLVQRASRLSLAQHRPGSGGHAVGDDSLVLVERGGRVEFLGARVREWFGLGPSEAPDLDLLARRVRPSDQLLELCASPGSKRLTVNGQLLEITSYRVPGDRPPMLLAVRPVEFESALGARGSSVAPSSLNVVSEFGLSIASNLDLDSVVRSILENTRTLIPTDALELGVWDEAARELIAFRLVEPDMASPRLLRSSHGQFVGLRQRILDSRKGLLLPDSTAVAAGLGVGAGAGVASYMGVVLNAEEELVGTLEAGRAAGAPFGEQEFRLLQMMAPPIGAALRNAFLYEHEQRRSTEYAGLAGVIQALQSIRKPGELFGRLLEVLSPLINSEILGFLLYDENRRLLVGQAPFRGLPESIVQLYRVRIEPGSSAETLLSSRSPIVADQAAHDENWRALGLASVAVAASLRDSVLMPLVASNHLLGYMQVSHRRTPDSDLRLLQIIADQVAGIIESVLLLRQNQEQIARSSAIGRLAATAASAATADQMLSSGLTELASLLRADVAGVLLLDDLRGELRLHSESAVGLAPLETSGLSVHLHDPEYADTATASAQALMLKRIGLDALPPAAYLAFFQGLNIESALMTPLVARGRSLGEVILGSRTPDHFEERDLELAGEAASSFAAAMDKLGLEGQTDRTLRRRVSQLESIARVSRQLGAARSIDDLLGVVHRETIGAAGADCGSILLVEPGVQITDPRRLQSVGCPFGPELTPLERRSLEHRQSLSVSDFTIQPELNEPHTGVRSALLVPILQDGQALGLIQLHALEPDRFDQAALDTVETLAIQAGVALRNSFQAQEERRKSELLERRAQTVQKLFQSNYALDPDMPLEEALGFVAKGIQDSTPFRIVLVSVYEDETGLLRRVAGAGIEPETLEELRARKQPFSTLRQLAQPQFRISNSYFVPADQTPILPADIHYAYAGQYSQAEVAQNAWNPDDFLLLPLEGPAGEPLGLVSLDNPSNGLRPDLTTIESIELFAAQAVQIIMNSRRVADLRGQIATLSSGISRQQELLGISQNDLPVLLRKDLEQTIALHALDRRAQRIRAGLAIAESVSSQLDASSALLALARETLTQFGMAVALVAENTTEGARLLHVLGNVPTTINIEALFGQRNPLRSSLQTGAPILISDIDSSEEWRETPLLGQLRAKGVISLPILIENRPLAAIMVLGKDPLPGLTEEDRQIYLQIARQASVVLQNISLLHETRRRLHEVNILLDFSRQLVGLDPGDIVQALLNSSRHALAAAHAGAVLLWNEGSDRLETRAASGYADDTSMLELSFERGEALPGMVFEDGTARRVDEIDFARDYALQPADLGTYRRGTGGRLPVSSLLLPIVVEGRPIGIILLDNFNTSGAFAAEDEALIHSLAQQAALSLENVRLLGALRERAGQLQGLNEVATALASSLRFDQLVETLLDRIGSVIPYDVAGLWLHDGERLRFAADRGLTSSETRPGRPVPLAESALLEAAVEGGKPLYVSDVREDDRFPPTETPRLSWLALPMLAKGRVTGLVVLEKWQASSYSPEQVQLGATLASQAAVALENARLYEDSVDHAAELDERSQRLAVLNRVAAALGGLLDAQQILGLAAEETRKAFDAERAAVISFDGPEPAWVLSSPAARRRLPQAVPDGPLFARLRESLETYVVDDVAADPEFASMRAILGNDTGAALAIPLVAGGRLLALLLVANPAADAFGEAEIDLARTVANQASIALQSATLYQATVRAAEHLTLLNRSGADMASSLDPEQIYASIERAASQLMPLDAFGIALLDDETQEVEAVYLTDQGRRLPSRRAPLGRGLGSRVISTGAPLLLNEAATIVDLDGGSWTQGAPLRSAVAVPMTVGNRAVGMLSARSRAANAYAEDDLRLLATLANQAVATIQNGRLFSETQRLAEELEQRVVERTSELQREQQNTETLLRILSEVSSSLDMDRALDRTLTLLNDAVRADQGTIMLLNPDDNLLHYRAGFGYVTDQTPRGGGGLRLQVGQGLAGWVVNHREPALVDDVREDPRWLPSTNTARDHRSAVAAPLMVAEDVIGVLMVFSRRVGYFTAESLALIQGIASQVAVAINNARLYELVRDQAERLGHMLRREEEEASRSQAILESVADGVLVTSADNLVSFLNDSVGHILGPDVAQNVGQSIEEFSALFGEAGQAWAGAIRRWSEAPSQSPVGDTYAERLELANDRIALIHLAPVILESDFLGTVSILRDITHEVEVDRLKSEFVATVSHELRTPMTAVKGYVEMLLMGAVGAVNEQQTHFLEIVRNNIDRLNALVGDLLDVSRIESGKASLAPEPLDMRAVAKEMVDEIRVTAERESKPISISIGGSKTVPSVMGDPARVRQILRILLENAYHYTPENGAISVKLRSKARGSEVRVDVSDNGIGIAAEDQDRIFDRFYRGENALVLATPGTGLGLSIARQLVEMHGGAISVDSEGVEGRGSTFSFTLPTSRPAERRSVRSEDSRSTPEDKQTAPLGANRS